MARRKVITVPMFKYARDVPSTPFLGWGKYAIRKATTEATSPRLLKYRSCIASKLKNKKFANLEEVQKAFREAAHHCKAQL